jgi:hypothetical protein
MRAEFIRARDSLIAARAKEERLQDELEQAKARARNAEEARLESDRVAQARSEQLETVERTLSRQIRDLEAERGAMIQEIERLSGGLLETERQRQKEQARADEQRQQQEAAMREEERHVAYVEGKRTEAEEEARGYASKLRTFRVISIVLFLIALVLTAYILFVA